MSRTCTKMGHEAQEILYFNLKDPQFWFCGKCIAEQPNILQQSKPLNELWDAINKQIQTIKIEDSPFARLKKQLKVKQNQIYELEQLIRSEEQKEIHYQNFKSQTQDINADNFWKYNSQQITSILNFSVQKLKYDEIQQSVNQILNTCEGRYEGIHGIVYYPDGSSYQGQFDENMNREGKGELKRSDLHYIGEFHEQNFHGKGRLVRKNKIVEGDFFEGQAHGQVTIYNDGKKTYEGQMDQGDYHGYGKYYDAQQSYVGYFERNNYEGEGELKYVSGTVKTGQFKNDKFVHGTWKQADWEYTGSVVDGNFEGQGKLTTSKSFYEGGFHNDKKHGHGVYRSVDGDFYVGQWDNDQKVGSSQTKITTDEYVYEGECFQGKPHGKGYLTYQNGAKMIGNFKGGQPFGECRLEMVNGIVYDGDFREGGFNGIMRTPPNNIIHINEENFQGGEKTGHFRQMQLNGERIEGEMIKGQFHGEIKYYKSFTIMGRKYYEIYIMEQDKKEVINLFVSKYCGQSKFKEDILQQSLQKIFLKNRIKPQQLQKLKTKLTSSQNFQRLVPITPSEKEPVRVNIPALQISASAKQLRSPKVNQKSSSSSSERHPRSVYIGNDDEDEWAILQKFDAELFAKEQIRKRELNTLRQQKMKEELDEQVRIKEARKAQDRQEDNRYHAFQQRMATEQQLREQLIQSNRFTAIQQVEADRKYQLKLQRHQQREKDRQEAEYKRQINIKYENDLKEQAQNEQRMKTTKRQFLFKAMKESIADRQQRVELEKIRQKTESETMQKFGQVLDQLEDRRKREQQRIYERIRH